MVVNKTNNPLLLVLESFKDKIKAIMMAKKQPTKFSHKKGKLIYS